LDRFHTEFITILAKQLHETRHFRRVATPIFRRKGVDRQHLNAFG
jgi:hypothetical protein